MAVAHWIDQSAGGAERLVCTLTARWQWRWFRRAREFVWFVLFVCGRCYISNECIKKIDFFSLELLKWTTPITNIKDFYFFLLIIVVGRWTAAAFGVISHVSRLHCRFRLLVFPLITKRNGINKWIPKKIQWPSILRIVRIEYVDVCKWVVMGSRDGDGRYANQTKGAVKHTCYY